MDPSKEIFIKSGSRKRRLDKLAKKTYVPPADTVDSVTGKPNNYNYGNVLTESGSMTPPPWHERPWRRAPVVWTPADEASLGNEWATLTKKHLLRPLCKYSQCIEPWESKKFDNTSKAAAYLEFKNNHGFLTWLDTECGDLLQPYGRAREENWPSTYNGNFTVNNDTSNNTSNKSTPSYDTYLKMLEHAIRTPALQEALRGVGKAVIRNEMLPMPVKLCVPGQTRSANYRTARKVSLFGTISPKRKITAVAYLKPGDESGIVAKANNDHLEHNTKTQIWPHLMLDKWSKDTDEARTPLFVTRLRRNGDGCKNGSGRRGGHVSTSSWRKEAYSAHEAAMGRRRCQRTVRHEDWG